MMVDAPVEVRRLDRDLMRAYLEEIVALDARVRSEFGPAYSHEAWDDAAFLSERPRKWELSGAALEEGQLVGFGIASRDGDAAHLHRLAVDRDARRRGVAQTLMVRLHEAARSEGLGRVALSVAARNEAARGFYEALGYRPLAGTALESYARRRSLALSPGGVRAGGHDYRILTRTLTDDHD